MNPLCSKRIFLTGGTGFFGHWLLRRFQTLEDVEVVVLSRNPEPFKAQLPWVKQNPWITFIPGDVRDFRFPSGRFDYVIHAATEANAKLDQEHPDEMYSVLVDGTQRVLDFSKQASPRRLLYISSGGVYGVQPPERSHIPETFPCRPVTAYGKGKLKAEQLCLESGVETVMARCFAFVGPWLPLDAHFAIGNFIGHCLRNEPIEIQGDGTPLRSYMYGSDLAEWLLKLLWAGRAGEIYNVGSDQAVSISDLARRVRRAAGTTNEIRTHRQPTPGDLPSRYIPSIEKAANDLGLSLKIGLEEALIRTFVWHRTQGPSAP